MRFPLFNLDWIPTGETMSHEDYFNPTVNRSWNAGFNPTDASTGLISLKNLTLIGNALVKLCTPEEINLTYRSRYGGERIDNTFFGSIYRKMFEAWPDRHHYLKFAVGLRSSGSSTGGTWKIKVYVFYPSGISYQESTRDICSFECKVTWNGTGDSTPTFTDEQLEIFSTKLAEIVDAAHEGYNSRMGSKIYYNDTIVPNPVKQIYMFCTNRGLFYPEGSGRTLGGDWQYPSNIARAIEAGTKVRFTFKENFDTISFKEVPPPADRNTLSQVLAYSTNVLDYLPFTIKGPKEHSSTLYGVELETSSAYAPSEIIDAQKDLFFIMKQDSSIRGSFRNAYEMVTVPCSLRAHKRLWAEFFERIDYTKFDTSKDTGNGMHVHIDRKTFKSDKHLNRFTWFFIDPSHLDFLFLISERPSKNDLQNWAGFPRVPDSASWMHNARRAAAINGQTRGAIHFKGTKTVEIRIFKGIVSYATVLKNLEFVDSVVEYTRTTYTKQLSLSNYIEWLESTNKNKYTMLKQFLAEAKVSKLVENAAIDRIIYGCKNDDAIAERLNKSNIKLSNSIVTLLNKRRRKRTFILKDGKIHSMIRNTGLLAKLDKIAQQKQTRGAASFSVSAI